MRAGIRQGHEDELRHLQFGSGVEGRNDLARIIGDARRTADFNVLRQPDVADDFRS